MSAIVSPVPFASSEDDSPIRLVPTNLRGVYASPGPDASFDPRHATPAQLKQNGIFAPRPTSDADPARRAAWQRAFERDWKPKQRVVAESRPMPGRIHPLRLVRDRTEASNATATNWSGGIVLPKAKKWTSVYGTWSVPPIYKPGTPAGSDGTWDCSSWIGLGGYQTMELLQAGVTQVIGANNVTECWPWYEWLVPNYQQAATLFPYVYMTAITNMVVSMDDVVSVGLSYGTETLLVGSTTIVLPVAKVNFGNQTTGQHCSLVLTRPTGAVCDGSSAEWIMERYTLGDGTLTSMPRYGGIEFQGCVACSTPDTPPGTPNLGFAVDMVEGSTTLSDEILSGYTVTIHDL